MRTQELQHAIKLTHVIATTANVTTAHVRNLFAAADHNPKDTHALAQFATQALANLLSIQNQLGRLRAILNEIPPAEISATPTADNWPPPQKPAPQHPAELGDEPRTRLGPAGAHHSGQPAEKKPDTTPGE
jgi:hypothetical protein